MLNELLSSDPTLIKESSIDLSFPIIESEPPTREIGTDPMEPTPSALPIIVKTTNGNSLTTKPIFVIQTMNSIETSTNDYTMEDSLPLTPSSSSESPDEPCSNSPDNTQSSMLTNFDVNQYLI
jgi:hypothetical protein